MRAAAISPTWSQAARTCIAAGCHGITVHPRPDARHITFQDVLDLAAMLHGRVQHRRLPRPRSLSTSCCASADAGDAGPRPARRADLERGMEPGGRRGRLARRSARQVPQRRHPHAVFSSSLTPRRSNARATLGADRIELYTGPYAHAFGTPAGLGDTRGASRSRAPRAENRTRRECGPRSRSQEYSRLREERSKVCRKCRSATR